MRFGLIFMLLSATASSAAAAEQFNLQCTKVVRGSSGPETNTRTYRIDLDAKLWCMDECDRARSIKAVTPDQITINETDPAERRYRASHYIYRGTGKYVQTYDNRSLGSFIVTEGQCEPAPFTGLPATKF